MKLHNFIFLLLALCLVLPMATALQSNLGTFKQGSCIDLIQTCDTCTYNVITSVVLNSVNSVKVMGTTTMTKSGLEYNTTFCNTSLVGIYTVNGYGDLDGSDTIWNYPFEVNPIGVSLTNSQAILYFLVFGIALIFFVIVIYLGVESPYQNKRDAMTGYIFAIENLKYLKIVSWGVAYLLLMLMSYFAWMISYGYLDMPFIGSLFNFAFYTLLVLLLPLFVIGVYILIANAIRDHKIGEMISGGLRVR